MIATGHQPQFLPYIGIFNKIAKGDIFIFVDNIQFNKKSWQNRTLIKTNIDKSELLTVPVITKGKFYQNINEVKVNNDMCWKRKHIKSLTLNYKKTIGFEEVFHFIEDIYNRDIQYLVEITIPLMELFINLLDIKTTLVLGSDVGIEGFKTDLLVDICQKVKSDAYLSGAGAKGYFKPDVFRRNNLNHHFNYFIHPKYNQVGKIFLEGMAIVDLFFNEGIENSRKIFWDNVNENKPFE